MFKRLKRLKCVFGEHDYEKPRVKQCIKLIFGCTLNDVSVATHIVCKNCGKKKQLTPLEQMRIFVIAKEFRF